MGSDARTLVHITDDQWVPEVVAAFSSYTCRGEWIEGSGGSGDPARLSKRTGTVVTWSIQTVVDSVSLEMFVKGRRVRWLEYCGEDGGWLRDFGVPAVFEDVARLRRWKRRRVLASPHGYQILEDFLGASGRNRAREKELEALAKRCDPFAAGVSRAVAFLSEQARTRDVYAAAFVVDKGWLELRVATEEARTQRMKKALPKEPLLRQSRHAREEAFRWDLRGWAPKVRVAKCETDDGIVARLSLLLQDVPLPRIPILLEHAPESARNPSTMPFVRNHVARFDGQRQFVGTRPRTLLDAFEKALATKPPAWSTEFLKQLNFYLNAHPRLFAADLIARATKAPRRAEKLLEPLRWGAEPLLRKRPRLVEQLQSLASEHDSLAAAELLRAIGN